MLYSIPVQFCLIGTIHLFIIGVWAEQHVVEKWDRASPTSVDVFGKAIVKHETKTHMRRANWLHQQLHRRHQTWLGHNLAPGSSFSPCHR